MLNVKKEIHLSEFKAWDGGKDRLDEAIKYGVVDELQDYLISVLGTDVTASELNEELWFGCDDFLEEVIEEIE